MEYESVLLIGGPRDGQWVSVTKGIPSIRMAQLPVNTSYLGYGEALTAHVAELKDVTYDRYPMMSSHGLKTAVYVYGGIDPLLALINGYKPSVTDRRS